MWQAAPDWLFLVEVQLAVHWQVVHFWLAVQAEEVPAVASCLRLHSFALNDAFDMLEYIMLTCNGGRWRSHMSSVRYSIVEQSVRISGKGMTEKMGILIRL